MRLQQQPTPFMDNSLKMPLSTLATVDSPVLVGHSSQFAADFVRILTKSFHETQTNTQQGLLRDEFVYEDELDTINPHAPPDDPLHRLREIHNKRQGSQESNTVPSLRRSVSSVESKSSQDEPIPPPRHHHPPPLPPRPDPQEPHFYTYIDEYYATSNQPHASTAPPRSASLKHRPTVHTRHAQQEKILTMIDHTLDEIHHGVTQEALSMPVHTIDSHRPLTPHPMSFRLEPLTLMDPGKTIPIASFYSFYHPRDYNQTPHTAPINPTRGPDPAFFKELETYRMTPTSSSDELHAPPRNSSLTSYLDHSLNNLLVKTKNRFSLHNPFSHYFHKNNRQTGASLASHVSKSETKRKEFIQTYDETDGTTTILIRKIRSEREALMRNCKALSARIVRLPRRKTSLPTESQLEDWSQVTRKISDPLSNYTSLEPIPSTNNKWI